MSKKTLKIGRLASLLKRLTLAIASALSLSALLPASAQQTSSPTYDPRQLDQRFKGELNERTTSTRSRLPLPKLEIAETPPADTKPLFVLRQVSIAGATAISRNQLAIAYQRYLGKRVSQADLAAIATAVGDLYREAGFHLSRAIIPPQDINGGKVSVKVIEGSIDDVDLKGDGVEEFGLRQMVAPVLAEQPSRLATLERRLMLINTTPGVRILDTALNEIGNASGHFRLTISVKTWHIYKSFGVDNLGASGVGPWESFGTVAFNSAFLPGDTLALNLSTTPGDPRQLAFGRLSYDTPIGNDGWKAGISGLYSDVWPGDDRHIYADNTATEAFQLRTSITPLQSQRSSLVLTAAFDYTDAAEHDAFGTVYQDHVRNFTLSADYRLLDNFGGNNYLTTTLRQGIDALGASSRGDDLVSHLGASPTFTTANAWFTRYQTLTDTWSLKISGAAQAASGPLYLSQQFYLGGAAFGRGYGAAEVSGDNGMAGTLEARFDQKLSSNVLTGYQLYSFVDSGVAWNAGYRYTDGVSLVSVGGGVRFFLTNNTKADISLAAPLSYRAPDNPNRDIRVLFSLSSALELCPARASNRCF